MKHFLDLVRRGVHPGAASGETRARRLAKAVIQNIQGLDNSAIRGLQELITVATGRMNNEAERKAILELDADLRQDE